MISDVAVDDRPVPERSLDTDFFWKAGGEGVLRIQGCQACGALRHPPSPICADCGSVDSEPVAVSGRGVVAAFTINHQAWSSAFTPPYVIAVVELVEDPRVRLTTNILGCPPDQVRVGMEVRVDFEERAGVWLPMFVPDGPTRRVTASRTVTAPPPGSPPQAKFEDRVVLSGLGMSEVGRRLMRPPVSLTVEACQRALADAGLAAADIDGVSTFPGSLGALGFAEGGVKPVVDALRLQPTWVNGATDTNGMSGAIVAAMLAVASGLCRHVLCYRTVAESTQAVLKRESAGAPASTRVVGGEQQWRLPFGAEAAPTWFALYASRYFAEFGDHKEVLGRVAINARTNAGRNEGAVYRAPLTMEEYLAARPVSTPLGLYDCDVPCDGAVAVVVSARECVADLRCRPVVVEAVGTRTSERMSWDQSTLVHVPLVRGPAQHLWSRTSIRHDEVDVAQLYDGFSFTVLSWLEALGFCGLGEAGQFIGTGARIALDGELPLNTGGGQLSGGRLHGFGLVHETMLQLRGEAAGRQVKDARIGLVTTGGGMAGGCMLLRRWE
jgi:acetyl-CoA acetyltransferase/uncharacterized OB-fold protein